MRESFIDAAFAIFMAIVMLGAVLLIVVVVQDYNSPNDYTYIDLDDNTGFADMCGNGRGGMWCKAADKHILVKEYTVVKEEE